MGCCETREPTTKIQKIGVAVFFLIVFIPTLLSGIGNFFGKNLDVELCGYTDTIKKPELKADTFLSGNYQQAYTVWFDATVKPRGIFTKTYSTIRYNLFNLGNRPIGYNKDTYELSYIESELGLTLKYDMSLEANRKKIETYVENLEKLQGKLKEFGIDLYVYIPANKATLHLENIPEKYKAMTDPELVNVTEYFFELMQETSIPYLDTTEIGKELEYPAFYSTGIHWSRPFEQTVSKRIVADLCQLTGKNYRQLELNEIMVSADPFWRDTDVFDLLNVWNKTDVTYYEYSTEPITPESFDRMGILLSGTSFGQGLRKDILDTYPTENVYYVNRSEYFLEPNGAMLMINGDWDALNLAEYLDKTDVVVVENIAPELANSSYGFVEYLLQVLETYTPGEKSGIQMFDGTSDIPLDERFTGGFWGKEVGFSWVRKESVITLQNSEITEKGLQIDFNVSDMLIAKKGAQDIHIYVNGEKVFSKHYNAAVTDSVIIPSDKLSVLQNESNNYVVSVLCSNSFVPKELGINEDTRELALMVEYIGRAK